MIRLFCMASLVVCFSLLGCSDGGPARHRISGKVSLDGKPIPFGEVIFTPDSTKKNTGPQGKALIKDGVFDTDFPGGLGISGGPTVVRVNGLSGPGGKTLCEYETSLDLPAKASTKDFDVPAKEAHNANPKGGNAKPAPEI